MYINKAIDEYKLLPVQIRASFWFLICSFLQRGISMIMTPIFTRIMTPRDYGQYGVFNSWYSIISIIVALSLTGGVHTQGLIKYDKDRNIFSSSLQGLTIVMVCGWLVIYLMFYKFWNTLFSLSTFQMLLMFVIIWTTSVFGFWANNQRVIYSYQILVTVTIITSIAKPALEIIFVKCLENKATARILGWVIVDFIAYGWMFIFQMKKGRVFYSKKFWTYALTFNLPLVPHYLSQTVLNSADRIMIQKMIGDSEAGIYSLAYSLALIMTLFNTAFMQTISPWIYQKIKYHKEKEISSIIYISMSFIAFVNLTLILFAPEAVAFFAPKSYYDAIMVIPPVAMSVFFMYCYDVFAKFAFYYEKTNFIMIASATGAFLNIILNYIFINLFGYIAAGYTTLACFIIYSISHYYFMNKVCDQFCEGVRPYDIKKILQIAIPFIVCGFVLLMTYNYPYVRYGIVIVVVILVIVFRKRLYLPFHSVLALRKSRIKHE
jgi:O-antigen/teichoic acid export membrane protein